MDTFNILWRNLKWRFQNPISILLTIIQPLMWLVLYGVIAGQLMQNISGGNYTAFILPGIMTLVILSCCSSSGYLNFVMKSRGSFYRVLIAPVKRSAIVLGQMLEAILLSFIEIAVLILLSMFFSVRIASGFTGIILMLPIIFLAAFFMAGITYTISLYLPNEVVYETIMNLVVLSIFFTSVALFPIESLSGNIKIIVMLNPFSHVINCLRKLILETSIDWKNFVLVISIFIGLGGSSFALAVRKLKQEFNQ